MPQIIIDEAVSGWLLAAGVIIVLLALLSRIRVLAGLLLRGLIGISGIFIADFLLSPLNIAIGINFWTALISSVLGIPGICLMFLLVYVFNG